jgi:hypothetical protein
MSYQQNRVYVSEYGTISATSPLLAPVPTVKGKAQQFVHVVVANRFAKMDETVFEELGIRLLVASGRRPLLWPTKKAYEADMIRQYGSVVEGRKWRAFVSAHQTGLVLDLGCGGLTPNRKTIDAQKKTLLFLWLKENMWRYGFTPYLPEPWHIECRIPFSDYHSGHDSGIRCLDDCTNAPDDHTCCEE